MAEVSHLQLNFYGIKLEAPSCPIRVEQSLSDRSKTRFSPIKVDLGRDEVGQLSRFQTSAGRLHFTETTANNMRKKGKPNPAQKYFRLVVALEAVTSTPGSRPKQVILASLASERIIVRASNPGQFEPDTDVTWQKEPGSDTVYYMGMM